MKQYKSITTKCSLTEFGNWLENEFLGPRMIPMGQGTLVDGPQLSYELYEDGTHLYLFLKIKYQDSDGIEIVPEVSASTGMEWVKVADEHMAELREALLRYEESLYGLRKPGPGAPDEEWFQYKRRCDEDPTERFTHEQMAEELCLSPGHVRNEYASWKRTELPLLDESPDGI